LPRFASALRPPGWRVTRASVPPFPPASSLSHCPDAVWPHRAAPVASLRVNCDGGGRRAVLRLRLCPSCGALGPPSVRAARIGGSGPGAACLAARCDLDERDLLCGTFRPQLVPVALRPQMSPAACQRIPGCHGEASASYCCRGRKAKPRANVGCGKRCRRAPRARGNRRAALASAAPPCVRACVPYEAVARRLSTSEGLDSRASEVGNGLALVALLDAC
jgi:hypothetical protein